MIIDVLRAFTVSAYAIAGGAREVRFVPDLDAAIALAAAIPGALLSAEVDGLPVAGVEISNSPTMIRALDLTGRVLVQRSSAGVQALTAAAGAEALFAASLVVAEATAERILAAGSELVTLVASRPDHHEDPACAAYLEALLLGETVDLSALLRPLRASARYAEISAGRVPGFPPTDLALALDGEAFAFALPVVRSGDGFSITP